MICVPEDVGCHGEQMRCGEANICPGIFSVNTTYPVQVGEVVLISYTVTGEMRFFDFWANNPHDVRCKNYKAS